LGVPQGRLGLLVNIAYKPRQDVYEPF